MLRFICCRLFLELLRCGLRNSIVVANIGLVKRSIKGQNRDDIDDLFQIASMAALRAVERFDYDSGYALSTYLVPTVRGALLHHWRDASRKAVARGVIEGAHHDSFFWDEVGESRHGWTLTLKYQHGLRNYEIATRQGISPYLVAKRLRAGLLELRESMA